MDERLMYDYPGFFFHKKFEHDRYIFFSVNPNLYELTFNRMTNGFYDNVEKKLFLKSVDSEERIYYHQDNFNSGVIYDIQIYRIFNYLSHVKNGFYFTPVFFEADKFTIDETFYFGEALLFPSDFTKSCDLMKRIAESPGLIILPKDYQIKFIEELKKVFYIYNLRKQHMSEPVLEPVSEVIPEPIPEVIPEPVPESSLRKRRYEEINFSKKSFKFYHIPKIKKITDSSITTSIIYYVLPESYSELKYDFLLKRSRREEIKIPKLELDSEDETDFGTIIDSKYRKDIVDFKSTDMLLIEHLSDETYSREVIKTICKSSSSKVAFNDE